MMKKAAAVPIPFPPSFEVAPERREERQEARQKLRRKLKGAEEGEASLVSSGNWTAQQEPGLANSHPMPSLLETPFTRYPRISSLLLIVSLLSLFITLQSSYSTAHSGDGTVDAPSLKKRLEVSEELWRHSVNMRHAAFNKFDPEPPPFPSAPGLPYYTLWSFFTPSFNCPFEVQRVGTFMDGGRWICGLSKLAKQRDCIVYSFGQLGESSMEAELLTKTKCKVYGYDNHESNFGPEVASAPTLRPRSHFFPYVLGPKDKHTNNPPVWTLKNLMKAHGHKFIDVLRIDVEGSEFTLLTDLIASYRSVGEPLPFGQLQVELHALGKETKWMIDWWEMLEEAGLRAFMTEPNLVFANLARMDAPPGLAEYSFINIRGNRMLGQ